MTTFDAGNGPRHFRVLPADDYEAFCTGVHRVCGTDLARYKRGAMELCVRAWAQRRGHAALIGYVKALEADPDELGAFLDHMTTSLSQLRAQ